MQTHSAFGSQFFNKILYFLTQTKKPVHLNWSFPVLLDQDVIWIILSLIPN